MSAFIVLHASFFTPALLIGLLTGAVFAAREPPATIWGPDYGDELECLRTYVRTLRKKIEDDPAQPKYILTEPWVGYRFHNPSEEEL